LIVECGRRRLLWWFWWRLKVVVVEEKLVRVVTEVLKVSYGCWREERKEKEIL
jgi:hypothetical protein